MAADRANPTHAKHLQVLRRAGAGSVPGGLRLVTHNRPGLFRDQFARWGPARSCGRASAAFSGFFPPRAAARLAPTQTLLPSPILLSRTLLPAPRAAPPLGGVPACLPREALSQGAGRAGRGAGAGRAGGGAGAGRPGGHRPPAEPGSVPQTCQLQRRGRRRLQRFGRPWLGPGWAGGRAGRTGGSRRDPTDVEPGRPATPGRGSVRRAWTRGRRPRRSRGMRGAARAAEGRAGRRWPRLPVPGPRPPPQLLMLLAVVLGGAGAQYSSDLCSWRGR